MAALTRRLQVLLDDARSDRLQRESARTGAPVGALVRAAIDRMYPPHPDDRKAAAERLLAAPAMPVEDWSQMKRQLRDELSEP